MKIEMDEETSMAIITVAICVGVVAIAFMVYRYNVAAYEKGYTQKQLQNSQMTMWVKE
jgi:hypothetical protein